MKTLILFFALLSASMITLAQHYIVKVTGDTIYCKITKVGIQTLFYADSTNTNYTISLNKIKGYSTLGENAESYGKMDTMSNIDLAREVRRLNREIVDIKSNLYDAHMEYRTANVMFFMGSLIGAASTIYAVTSFKEKYSAEHNNKVRFVSISGMGFTSMLLIVSFVVRLDSHKSIGRAGGFKLKY